MSLLKLGDTLQLCHTLNHLSLDLFLHFWLIQVLNALEVALPLVDLCHYLIEEFIEFLFHFFLWPFVFSFLYRRWITIGWEKVWPFLSIFNFAFCLIFSSSNFVLRSSAGRSAPLGRIPLCILNFSCSFRTRLARSTPRLAGISLALLA